MTKNSERFKIKIENTDRIPCYESGSKQYEGAYGALNYSFQYKVAPPNSIKISIESMCHNNSFFNSNVGSKIFIYLSLSPLEKKSCVFILDGLTFNKHENLETYVVKSSSNYCEETRITKEFDNEVELSVFFQILDNIFNFKPRFLDALKNGGFDYEFIGELAKTKRNNYAEKIKEEYQVKLDPSNFSDCSKSEVIRALVQQVQHQAHSL